MFDKALFWICVLLSAAALVGAAVVMFATPYDWGMIAAFAGVGAGLAIAAAAEMLAPKRRGYPGGVGSWLVLAVLWVGYLVMFGVLFYNMGLFDNTQIFTGLLLALAVPAFCLVRATLRLARRGRPLIHRRETDAAPRTPTARPATT